MKKLLFVLFALPFIAFTQADVKIDKKYYQVNYSQKLKQPLSVDYGIRTRECNATRSGMDFFAEKGVITSSNTDYANNEWDKGHMAPAADFNCNKEMLYKTFTYLNSALQHQSLNRGIWKHLEMHERELAKKEKVEVIIDIEFDKEPKKVPGGASIPKGFYKHIRYKTGKVCYYFPNEAPKKSTYRDYQIQCDK